MYLHDAVVVLHYKCNDVYFHRIDFGSARDGIRKNPTSNVSLCTVGIYGVGYRVTISRDLYSII